ncbi:MAG TPA: hypothetical protein VNH18_19910 [Bryobacteraceae bacterium]|nr:hypothetical protein [Bryobacteraceae bacterium]HXJ41553.1 hypothetical protein [Bryobacteraceae bacterium]
MPPAQKPKRISLGSGKYYDPEKSRASVKHNARVLFLQAVENRTPAVLNALRGDPWDLYEALYRRVTPPQSEHDWLYSIHPVIVSDWFAGRPSAGWTPRARAALTRLKKSLFAWGSNYNILAEWTLGYALDTMMFWTEYESVPDRRRYDRWLRKQLDKALPSDGGTESSCYGIRYSWGIGAYWYFDKRERRHFEYQNWQGEDEGEYQQRIRVEFDQHLESYMSEIRNRASALPRTPDVTKPERFDMLALYLCGRMSRDRIAALPDFAKDTSVIYRDIREAADLIDLPLRPRGRPSKKLQSKPSE